jgi:hypothetical protein
MPRQQDVEQRIRLAADLNIGGSNVIDTVQARAAQSPMPNPFVFGLSILWVEGRIAQPSAFQSGWVSPNSPEKSPWQIHPDYHKFARETPATNFEAYTDYAYTLLENAYLDTGLLQDAARRYNSGFACEEGRSEACSAGRNYAQRVMAVMEPIEQALLNQGYKIGPDLEAPSFFPELPIPGTGGQGEKQATISSGILFAGFAALTGILYLSSDADPAQGRGRRALPEGGGSAQGSSSGGGSSSSSSSGSSSSSDSGQSSGGSSQDSGGGTGGG